MTDQPEEKPDRPGEDPDPQPPAADQAPEGDTGDHHHTWREDLEIIEQEAYVDAYKWGSTVMWIVLAVILLVIAVAGIVWLL